MKESCCLPESAVNFLQVHSRIFHFCPGRASVTRLSTHPPFLHGCAIKFYLQLGWKLELGMELAKKEFSHGR